MSGELRWILLACGALLIVGLWLWESIRARRKPLAEDPFDKPRTAPPPVEPVWEEPRWLSAEPVEPVVPEFHMTDDLPPLEPPVVHLPDHHSLEDDAALPLITPAPSAFDRPREAERAPVAPAPSSPPPPPSPPSPSPSRPPPASPPRQKIVALRLVGTAAGGLFPGTTLRTMLEAEGMEFGRYHIFHRELDEGRLLFSAASLIEPGSFDLETMAGDEFPGISLFAVLPGALPATQVFDEMIASSRRLAARLGGQLQDDRRLPLTAARLVEMRAELEAMDRARHPDGDDADA